METAGAEASIICASEAAAGAAQEGAERTKEMVARIGKAKTLGERSLGHPDPGAVSMHLILRAMADFIRSTLQRPSS
jgi:dihydroxyacetone kinase-like protein